MPYEDVGCEKRYRTDLSMKIFWVSPIYITPTTMPVTPLRENIIFMVVLALYRLGF